MPTIPCALCGTNVSQQVSSRAGIACLECLGEAMKQVISGKTHVSPPTVTASHRCLLCSEPIVAGNIVATRGPYCLCQQCLSTAWELVTDFDDGTINQFSF